VTGCRSGVQSDLFRSLLASKRQRSRRVSSGTGGNSIIYMISLRSSWGFHWTISIPQSWISSSSSAPSSLSLSSLSLTDKCCCGAQSSTGSVTLSAPAPSVGQSHSPAATPAPGQGAFECGPWQPELNATFYSQHQCSRCIDTVTISASYSGVTKTASLTVTPAPPPPATSLFHWTLNPSSVIGGAQSSTGSVTLNARAPSGGRKSPSPAATPAPPGCLECDRGSRATSATLQSAPVQSLHSTTVTISASYGGVTKTASLTVTPAPPPPTTLSSLTLTLRA